MRDWGKTKVHLVGIGGSGMSGIARIMAARGAAVSGSDLHDSSSLAGLRTLGIAVHIGHAASNIGDASLVIRSSAIPLDNPELRAAQERGITIIERAQALAQLMEGKRSVAVAGTHGKTTTTSMLTVALQHCGFDPSFSIGATVRNSGTNAHHGSGDTFIVEADESDGSFTAYKPLGAIITNIELDHVDNFKNLAEIEGIFRDFVRTIQPEGFLVLCADDQGTQTLLSELRSEKSSKLTIVTYGEDALSDVKLDRIFVGPKSASARVVYRGRVLGEMELSITGRHNILNAAGALAAAIALGANPLEVIAGLKLFTGARRRFEIKGVVNGVTVVDDYGHHPTEITATLETARIFAGTGRVLAVFQPHRYSRTQAFAPQFAASLSSADHTYLLEIYPASEKPIVGVTSSLIAQQMESTKVSYEPSMPTVVDSVAYEAKPGDVIITLGAGDVSALGPLIIQSLETHKKQN
jgi:UDP-N-acetylmuramate--alanine ligase